MIELNNPEQQVLTRFVRGSLEHRRGASAERDINRAVDEVRDWEALVQAALDHGMLGLVWFCSSVISPNVFPSEIKAALATFIESQRAENTGRTDKLVKIFSLLADAGIRAAPFKGPLLAEMAYGDIGMRTFWDLDFLVPESEFDRAVTLLSRNGFVDKIHPPDGYGFTDRQLAKLLRYWGQAALIRNHDGMAIEPHLSITPLTLALDLDGLWRRASPGTWRGMETWFLEPEDHLIILCLQGAKPYWDNLKLPADLAHFIVAHPQLDWDRVSCRARSYGFKRLVAIALLLAERLFGIALPKGALALARNDAQAASITTRLVHQSGEFRYHSTDASRLSCYHIETRERLFDKLRYVLRVTCLPREAYVQSVRLPDSVYWLYSPLKLFNDAYVLMRSRLRRLF